MANVKPDNITQQTLLNVDFLEILVGCADSKYTQRRWLDKLTVCQKKLYSV